MENRRQQLYRQKYSQEIASNRNCADFNDALTRIENNSDFFSFNRYLYQENKEIDIEKSLFKDKQLTEKRQNQIEMDTKLAYSVNLQKEKYRDDKMRQQLRESNQELRKLELQLRNAYITKGLHAQRAEKEAILIQEKLQIQLEHKKLLEARKTDEEFERIKIEDVKKKKLQLRHELQDQIITAHQRKQFLYEEFLKEKKYLDEIVKRIFDEHMEELNRKLLQKQRLQVDMKNFKKSQEIWRKKQQIEIEEENKRIFEFLEQKEDTLNLEKLKKQAEAKTKSELSNKMVQELFEKSEKAREREELLIDLKIEEVRELDEQKLRQEMEIELRRRIETRLVLDQQRQDNQFRFMKEQEEDHAFFLETMKVLAEKDKLDQLSNERRRQKQMDHRREIQELLELRKSKRVAEFAGKLKIREIEEREEQRKEELIEEERIKMLKEHAAALIGFLPRGILRDSDREFLSLPPSKYL